MPPQDDGRVFTPPPPPTQQPYVIKPPQGTTPGTRKVPSKMGPPAPVGAALMQSNPAHAYALSPYGYTPPGQISPVDMYNFTGPAGGVGVGAGQPLGFTVAPPGVAAPVEEPNFFSASPQAPSPDQQRGAIWDYITSRLSRAGVNASAGALATLRSRLGGAGFAQAETAAPETILDVYRRTLGMRGLTKTSFLPFG